MDEPDTTRIMKGGCHCGAVRFEVVVRTLEALDCNCSICIKKGFLHLIVGESDFTLLTDPDALSEYTFNTHAATHWFCRRCGIHPFYKPRSHPDGVDVNVRCLDETNVPFIVRAFDGQEWEENVSQIT